LPVSSHTRDMMFFLILETGARKRARKAAAR